MSEINLLKNELQKGAPLSLVPKSMTALYVVLGIFAVELLLFGGMLFFQKRVEREARGYEKKAAEIDLEAERVSAERKTAVSFQQRINNLQVLLQRHVFWTEALTELQDHFLKTVSLRSIQADDVSGVFTIVGTAPNYTELGKYILGLKTSSNIKDVDLKTTTQSQSGQVGYDFNAEIYFDTKVLSPYGGSPGGRQ